MPRFVEQRSCELCGAIFGVRGNYRIQRFCNRTCRNRANTRQHAYCADIALPLADRFRARYAVQPSGCWEWIGPRTTNGYGASMMNGSPERIASRLSWHLNRGPIPEGLMVLHKCDNPPCVNPDHLFLGVKSDNALDYFGKLRVGLVVPRKERPALVLR